MSDREEEEKKEKEFEMQEINRAINKYYALKTKYEIGIKNIKKRIIDREFKSAREKREEFRKQKIKCVNCRRPVGSIFQTKFNADTNSRSLIAKCGDVLQPCGLNININLGYSEMLPELITEHEQLLSKLKNDIIKEKNNTLFGYTTKGEAISHFEKMKVDVSEFTEMLELYYYFYLNVKPKKDRIYASQARVYQLIENIKTEVNSNNSDNAVDIYLSDLKPELATLMDLKYHMHIVEYDEKADIYTLIQRPNSFHEFEQVNGTPAIVSYTTDLPDDEVAFDGDSVSSEKTTQKKKKTSRSKRQSGPAKPKKTPKTTPKKRPKKELTEKRRIALRVKNNESIDFGTSDEDVDEDVEAEAESDAQTDIDEDLEMAQQEREIEQEH